MNKRNIFLWALYDFANSIVTIVFFLYFSQWLVVDQGVSDFWYNMIFLGSSLLLILTAPVLASISDRNKKTWIYLRVVTLLMIIAYFFTSLSALQGSVLLSGIAYLFAQYFYQFSFVFYNSLLPQLSTLKTSGFISGLGQTANWLGQITGILITLPIALSMVVIFGVNPRAETLFPAVLLSFLLILPVILFFQTRDKPAVISQSGILKEYKDQWTHLKSLLKNPGMGCFLLGYFFFNGAIITTSNNVPIYLEQVFHVADNTKSLFLGMVLIMAAVGAFTSGWIADKIGLRKSLFIVLGAWMIVFPLLAVVKSFVPFTIICTMFGFLYGSIWTVTRAVMVVLTPEDKTNYGFSFYTLAERSSTFLGPLSWGLIASQTSLGVDRYRLAMLAMGIFVALGFLIARKIPDFKTA